MLFNPVPSCYQKHVIIVGIYKHNHKEKYIIIDHREIEFFWNYFIRWLLLHYQHETNVNTLYCFQTTYYFQSNQTKPI